MQPPKRDSKPNIPNNPKQFIKGLNESRPRLSVAIVTYNEGHMLEECLESIKWADEIVIVDLGSTDNTLDVARRFTDRITFHEHVSYVELVRNFSIEQTTGEWILILDPDERVTSSLAEQIKHTLADDIIYEAVKLPRITYYFGRPIHYTGYGVDYIARLFRRNAVDWKPEVHFRPTFQGQVLRLQYDSAANNAILHINYTSVSQFIDKMNRYTTNEAQKAYAKGRRFRWYKPFYNFTKEFYSRFFLLHGYRDGIYGFIISLLFAIYWMVAALKLWEIEHNLENDTLSQ